MDREIERYFDKLVYEPNEQKREYYREDLRRIGLSEEQIQMHEDLRRREKYPPKSRRQEQIEQTGLTTWELLTEGYIDVSDLPDFGLP